MNSPSEQSQFDREQFVSFVPVMTREKFAELSGLPIGVVRGLINKGLLPTVSLGKRNLVNLTLINQRALEKEFS
jgi:hypothetical protein